jgi:hypothetical protein
MSRGLLRAGIVSVIALALVGGTATVALATDGDGAVDEVGAVEEIAPVEEVAPVEEILPAEEDASVEAVEPTEEEPLPEALPLTTLAPDVTQPVIRMGGIEQELSYMPGTTFTIWFECEDPESGIVSCVEDGGIESGDLITMTELGWNTWWVTAVNGAGTVSRFNIQAYVSVFWDSVVRVQLNDDEAQALNNWYNTPVAMRLTAQSVGAFPVREIRVNRGYGWGATRAATAVEDFTEEGITSFLFYALDTDGTASVVGQHIMKLDFTPPTIVATPFEDGAVFAQWAERRLYAECGDNLSGVSTCGFDAGRFLPTDVPGEHTAIVRATDRADNETVRVLHYTVLAGDVVPDPDEDPQGDPDPIEDPTDEPEEQPVPVIQAAEGDLETLAYTGIQDSRPLAALAGGLVLVGLLIAAGATWRRWERVRD